MAADIDQPVVAMRQSRFGSRLCWWLLLSLGYGITHRLMAMPSAMRDPKPEASPPNPSGQQPEGVARAPWSRGLQVDPWRKPRQRSQRPQPQPKLVAAPQAVATATTEPAVIEPAVAEPVVVQLEAVQADTVPPQVDLSRSFPYQSRRRLHGPMTCRPLFPPLHHARLSDPGADLPSLSTVGNPWGLQTPSFAPPSTGLGRASAMALLAAAEIAVLAQDADRLRQEWDLFQEEVRAEADRLERGPEATQAMTSTRPRLP